MIKSILTFLFPKTIASIKQDGVYEYWNAEDERSFQGNEEEWKEIDEYEERMRLEQEQLNQSYMHE